MSTEETIVFLQQHDKGGNTIISIAECLVITEIKNIDHMKLLAKWEVDECLLQAFGVSFQRVWHKFIWIQNEVSYAIGKNTPIKKK